MKQGEAEETEGDGLSGHSIAASIEAIISVLAPHVFLRILDPSVTPFLLFVLLDWRGEDLERAALPEFPS